MEKYFEKKNSLLKCAFIDYSYPSNIAKIALKFTKKTRKNHWAYHS